MTAYEPHPDSPAPKDGDRVKVGDGPVEGTWTAHDSEFYAGVILTDDSRRVYVIKGCPVTVLRPVECKHIWEYQAGGGYICGDCDLHAFLRLVPAREPVDLVEAVRVWQDALWDERGSIRAVLEWAGVPVKETP